MKFLSTLGFIALICLKVLHHSGEGSETSPPQSTKAETYEPKFIDIKPKPKTYRSSDRAWHEHDKARDQSIHAMNRNLNRYEADSYRYADY